MKHMKRFMALFAALALVLAMAVPAFADGGAGTGAATTEKGKITINNAVSGVTYNFYRIMEIETHTDVEPYTGVIYKTNTEWKDFVSDKQWETCFKVNADNTVTVLKKEADNSAFAKKFAAEAAKVVDGKTADYSVPATGGKVEKEVELGYYLVVPEGWTGVSPVVCSLGSTNPNVTINEKNSDTTTEKKIMENGVPKSTNSASIGDTVNYKTTINVKDGDPQKYVLHDKMSGLNFDPNSVEVKVTGTNARDLTKDTDYTVATSELNDDCTFHINFIAGKLKANDVVEVTYSAKVAASAAIGGSGNKNETHLVYGENKHTTPSETKTYVWSFDVHKYTGENTALAGAKFKVWNSDKSKTAYFKHDATAKVYKFAGWTAVEGAVCEFTTPDDGNIAFEGLNAGTYYLEEIEAPKGYNKLTKPIEVKIADENGAITVDGTSIGNTTVKVENKAGTVLPGTGGIGTTVFYLIGGGLMVAAAVLLIAKKRMENK